LIWSHHIIGSRENKIERWNEMIQKWNGVLAKAKFFSKKRDKLPILS
jgi:hypothetical protein